MPRMHADLEGAIATVAVRDGLVELDTGIGYGTLSPRHALDLAIDLINASVTAGLFTQEVTS